MATTGQDFTIWSGDDKSLVITLTDGTDTTGGSAVWTLANSPTGPSLVRLTTDAGITMSGSVITVTLQPSHTAGLAGIFYHECQFRNSASKVATTTVGTVVINYDVAQ